MRGKDSYSVAIVDDHILFAQALEKLINTFDSFEVSCHAKNGMDFLNRMNEGMSSPDVVLLDVNMPLMNGLETMQYLQEYHPQARVLALSMDNDEHTKVKMIQAGAKGYLLKDIHPNVFQEAMTKVIEDDYYYDDYTSKNIPKTSSLEDSSTVQLKEREVEFLRLACTEKTYKEIASDMFLSPKTIDGYRENLFEKLKVRSRIGLVLFAIKNNLCTI